MRTRISEAWGTIIGGLWFVPLMMVILSIGLAILTLWLDSRFSTEWSSALGLIYSGSVVGGRDLFSTIAGSMITVTGLVFSITMVTLSLTTNQYGPRLLRNFLSDRSNQIVLGTFMATFTYSLLILRTLQGTGDAATAPEISITVGSLLALSSLGVLIYFIHHISDSIQSTSILSAVGRDLDEAVDRLFPEHIGTGPPQPDGSRSSVSLDDYQQPPRPLTVGNAGYIRAIDAEGVLNAAVAHNALVRLTVRPGGFVYKCGRIGEAWVLEASHQELERKIQRAIVTGKSRTPFQDIEFLMSQLLQAALLALSPATNNSLVAMTAIDWIGGTLAQIAKRELPSPHGFDDEDQLRVISETETFVTLLEYTFNPIRESARGNTNVAIYLLHTVGMLAPHVSRETDRDALRNQSELIQADATSQVTSDFDRQRVLDSYQRTITALFTEPSSPQNVGR